MSNKDRNNAVEKKKKIGFLFGAGAELSYGMPTGGKFALEIFRRDSSNAKEVFKKNRAEIDKSSRYASYWLPEEYVSKKVGAFGETVFENIIRDTIGNNRDSIVDRINKFDDIAKAVLDNQNITVDSFREDVYKELRKNFSDININQSLSYNNFFNKGNLLFKSNYFAILLTYYKQFNEFSELDKQTLGDMIKSIFQLHIGAMSESLSKNLQENIFSTDDLELDIFDDLGGNLSVNYQAAGVKGLELLSRKKEEKLHRIVEFAYGIVEKIYADVLDYKSVIDSNWHYLYTPKSDWAKFCKISIFLHSVREYITEECKFDKRKIGYYDDLNSAQEQIDITTVATSNYVNDLIGSKLSKYKDSIVFLNGSIDDYYDPYMNSLINKNEFSTYKHFAVPLIFTQSGTKPMTSIDISAKYVGFYNKLKNSDYICSIGFGFNEDDEHINGIIRTLIERDNKTLVVVTVNNGVDRDKRIDELAANLKVSKTENIKMIIVNDDREVVNDKGKVVNKCWINELEKTSD